MTGTIERNALREFLSSGGLDGIVAPTDMGIGGRTTGAPTASRSYYLFVRPARDVLVSSIGPIVTVVAGANDNLDVGLLDAQGNKIVSSGATAGKLNVAQGIQSIAVTPTLLKARVAYYAVCSFGTFGGTAVQVYSCNFTGSAGDCFGTEPGRRIAGQQSAQTTVPTLASMSVSVQPPVLILK